MSPTAGNGDPAARRDAARDGRAAAMSRRRALAAGRAALTPAPEPVRTGSPEAAELRALAVAVDATSPARLGRALSMHRRRQLSQGKQALNGTDAPVFIVHRGRGG